MNPLKKRIISVAKEHEDILQKALEFAVDRLPKYAAKGAASYMRNPAHHDQIRDFLSRHQIPFDDSHKDVHDLPDDQAHYHW